MNFVETPFTQSADVLRSGSVDAVATGEPFSIRIADEGTGTLLVAMSAVAPGGTPNLFYAATRDWARANAAAVPAFQAAIADAVRFQASDPEGRTRQCGQVHQAAAGGDEEHQPAAVAGRPSPRSRCNSGST